MEKKQAATQTADETVTVTVKLPKTMGVAPLVDWAARFGLRPIYKSSGIELVRNRAR